MCFLKSIKVSTQLASINMIFLVFNGKICSIMKTFTSVAITYPFFDYYTSTQFNGNKIGVEYHFKVFITTCLENTNHPSIFYEWGKNLIWNCINIAINKHLRNIIEEEVTLSLWKTVLVKMNCLWNTICFLPVCVTEGWQGYLYILWSKTFYIYVKSVFYVWWYVLVLTE